jgi:3-(3-hydroxy-phenyl)propionate hydroxylase
LAAFCPPGAQAAEYAKQMETLVRSHPDLDAVLILEKGQVAPSTTLPWVQDSQGLLAKRYDARGGTAYLMRPDQHIAARWRTLRADAVEQALARACGN